MKGLRYVCESCHKERSVRGTSLQPIDGSDKLFVATGDPIDELISHHRDKGDIYLGDESTGNHGIHKVITARGKRTGKVIVTTCSGATFIKDRDK